MKNMIALMVLVAASAYGQGGTIRRCNVDLTMKINGPVKILPLLEGHEAMKIGGVEGHFSLDGQGRAVKIMIDGKAATITQLKAVKGPVTGEAIVKQDVCGKKPVNRFEVIAIAPKPKSASRIK